jgi:predicted nucleic acid-binding protein
MNVIDTNIWIYCHDSRDIAKQRIAQQLVETVEPLALPWQIGWEFCTASRKMRAFGFSQEDAWLALEDMRKMANAYFLPAPDSWRQSRLIQQQHGLHFWDAYILATCIHYEIDILYSEVFPQYNDFYGLKIVNPFLA